MTHPQGANPLTKEIFGCGSSLPDIVDEPAVRSLDLVDECDKQLLAVRVGDAGHVLAFEGRLDGMHDDDWGHVVNPQVLLALVTKLANRFLSRGLRFGNCHSATVRLLGVVGKEAVAGFDDASRLGLLAGHHLDISFIETNARNNDEAKKTEGDDHPQLDADPQILERHGGGAFSDWLEVVVRSDGLTPSPSNSSVSAIAPRISDSELSTFNPF